MKISSGSLRACFSRSYWMFAGIAVLALVLRWMELLVPGEALWSRAFYGQVSALSELLPLYVLLLPVLTGLAGRDVGRDDPLRALGVAAVLTGGFCFLAGFLQGGLESGWVFAAAHPLTRDLVSTWQLLGILSSCFGIALLSLLRTRDTQNFLLRKTALLTVPGVALIASAALFALKQRLTGMDLVEPTVWFTGPAWPVAAGTSLLHTAALLSLLGLVTDRAGTPSDPAFRRAVPAVILTAFLAPEFRMLPADVPALPLLAGTFGHALLLCSWMVLLFTRIRKPWATVQDVQVLMPVLLSGLVILLGFWLNLVTASSAFSLSHLETARRFALGGAALFALLPAMDGSASRRLAMGILVFATLGVLLPLLWLGGTAVPAGLALYPPQLFHAHAFAFFAGLVFLGTLLFLVRTPSSAACVAA